MRAEELDYHFSSTWAQEAKKKKKKTISVLEPLDYHLLPAQGSLLSLCRHGPPAAGLGESGACRRYFLIFFLRLSQGDRLICQAW